MDSIFKALADATRREMLDTLYERPGLTLSELVAEAGMARQSATRHIEVLEAADLVVSVRKGREKLHYLNPVPIGEIGDRWIHKFSKHRVETIAALKSALEENSNE